MKTKILIALLALLLMLVISGCKPTTEKVEKEVEKTTLDALIAECENACKAALAQGIDLSSSPCLLDPMSNSEWVCDIAHEPREAVDNLRENQCNAWHNQTAQHFIELTPDCKFIKAY